MAEAKPQYTHDQLHQEQVEIYREIDDWRRWWTEVKEYGIPHFGEMGIRIAQIRDQLARHFRHEEQSDPFAHLTDPKDRQTAQRLMAEHGRLLADLNSLIDLMETCGCDQMCWGDARLAFEQFLSQLEGHEQEENRLMALQQSSPVRS